MTLRVAWRATALAAALFVVATSSAQSPSPAGAAPPATAKQAAPAKRAAQGAARAPVPEFKLVLEPRAIELLKATGAELAAAKSMSFVASVSYEYPSKLGPPILFTMRYDVTMRRPDKLKVLIPGDGPASEFYYDGKSMMAYVPADDLLAVADAPPTVDAALAQAYRQAAIYFPFTDLLAPDPYAALSDGANLAFYVGPSGFVGGVPSDMVAWANDEVFLQIWIGTDDKLPRRIRAIYRRDPYALRHQMDLTDWKLDTAIPPEAFSTQKAQTAKRIAFASPAGAALPPGVGPRPNAKSK